MQIGCTKKLQEFLKKDIIQADQDVDPFYTWSSSIMIVNRRRTIVVLHDESRCGFVLYGMTSRHIREIDHIIHAICWKHMESALRSLNAICRNVDVSPILPHGTAIQLHISTTFASRFPSFRKYSFR